MDKARIIESLRSTFAGDPWHGPSVQSVLEGVTAAQASRRPLPQAHTIWEVVRHMEAWVRVATRRVQGEACSQVPPEQDWPVVAQGEGEAAWQQSVASLEDSLAKLQEAVGQGQWKLTEEVPDCGYTFEFMLNGIIHHNLYHAGQIALLKKAGTGGSAQG